LNTQPDSVLNSVIDRQGFAMRKDSNQLTNTSATADITDLILADHNRFREQFARLDRQQASPEEGSAALEWIWRPLADKLDVHAYIEEKVFYPQLLRRGVDDPEGETLDAIGDHNDIRDGVRDADAAAVGSDEWWAGVGRAREANDDHMAEEEREGLSDFRRHAPIADRDPQRYVDDIEAEIGRRWKDTSLGIGSLKDR
jgi:hypothetical protein